MSDVFLLRHYDEARTEEVVRRIVDGTSECHALYDVDWCESFLSLDGRRLICRFEAPDAEAARTALRKSGSVDAVPWAGNVHRPPGADAPPDEEANVVVERSFPAPVTMPEIQAIEDAGAWCLETHDVRGVRSFFSLDGKRMLCFYSAPDAEAVRLAQRQAKMPMDDVWGFRHLQR